MIIKKSTCGLCKPTKKWKRNNTKTKQLLKKEIEGEVAVGVNVKIPLALNRENALL